MERLIGKGLFLGKTVDTNFGFYPHLNKFGQRLGAPNPARWSSRLLTDIIHPHGLQNIPKSMLFGIDNENQAVPKMRNSLQNLIGDKMTKNMNTCLWIQGCLLFLASRSAQLMHGGGGISFWHYKLQMQS